MFSCAKREGWTCSFIKLGDIVMKCLLIILKSNHVISIFELSLIILPLVLEPKEERTRTEGNKAPAAF